MIKIDNERPEREQRSPTPTVPPSPSGRGDGGERYGNSRSHTARYTTLAYAVLVTLFLPLPASAADSTPDQPTTERYRAARSVHLGWAAPEGELFYLEMVVQQSTPGSYFMACGWNTGYYGIQELGDGKKVAIFSVWDPTRGDNPQAVPVEQRVELLHSDPEVRIRRFGGEGTGGQCMMDFPWEIGQTNRFLLQATVQENKTAYAGYLVLPQTGQWKHLVTFRTRTGGLPLKGYYSFVEDFRRDYQSVHNVRRAWYGNGWVRSLTGDWVSLQRARFTASGATWESKENIDAGIENQGFYLATGGATKRTRELRSYMTQPPAGLFLPPALMPDVESSN